MKVSSVNSVNNKQNCNNQPNFKGITPNLIKFWHFVDTHGKAMQFTVEDMAGTNIPRTIKGAMAGYKYTGKINVPAFLQEALREFLTGPTMCVTPFVILSLGIKKMGKNIGTHIENLQNLSHLALKTSQDKGAAVITKDDFYHTIVQDLLKLSSGKETIEQADVAELAKNIKEYEALYNADTKGLSREAKKELKQKTSSALEQLQKLFERIIKKSKDSYASTDFRTATYSVAENKTGACNFKSYMNYSTSFANALFNKENNVEISQDTIKNFKTSWMGRRILMIGAMIGITGVLMSFIPKIYTIASGKVNPNARVIYDEAKGLNKKDKEAK